MEAPTGRPDAVLVDVHFPRADDGKHSARRAMFLELLGGERVESRGVITLQKSLLTSNLDHTFQFPKNSPREGQLQHDWFVAEKTKESPGWKAGARATESQINGHGFVLLGYLKPNEEPAA